MLVETIGLGMLMSFFLSEAIGLAAGGIVVPGYIALMLHEPFRVASTIAIALIAYIVTIARLVWAHRKPVDWSVRHAIAGIAWLMVAIALGIALAFQGAETELGARLASGYGVAGILGWMGNFIIGVSYYLFPAFVVRVRSLHRWRAPSAVKLSFARARSTTFVTYNSGLAAMIAGLLVANLAICLVASVAIAIGGLMYSAATLWTLSFAYRRGEGSGTAQPRCK